MSLGFIGLLFGLYALGVIAAIFIQIGWARRKRRRNARGFPVVVESSGH